jgi:ribulose-phosphate 3-epimerase
VIEDAGLKWVHLDIMDGHFVPNLSFGPQTLKAMRPDSKLFFDVHLMLDNPQLYIDTFLDAGAEQITIHVEPDYPVADTLAYIKSKGCKCGVVLKPDTAAEEAKEFLPSCDIVLLSPRNRRRRGLGDSSTLHRARGRCTRGWHRIF